MKNSASKTVQKPEAAKKKAIAKDVASNKKISSFFMKKPSSSSSIINHSPVKGLNEKSDSNNKRKIIESEEICFLGHDPKLRKIESYDKSASKTPSKVLKYIKSKEKCRSDSESHLEEVEKPAWVDPSNQSKFENNSAKNILPQRTKEKQATISTKGSPLPSLNLGSDSVFKQVSKEKIISDEDLVIDSNPSSMEENISKNSLNDTGSINCSSKGLNKENSFDNKIPKDCDKRLEPLEVDSSSHGLHFSELDNDIESFFDDNWQDILENNLDLSVLTRCYISEVAKSGRNVILTLKDATSGDRASVKCCDYWIDAKVEKGQVVTVQATKIDDEWVINNNSGFLIIEPDMLISGTTVVGALFCHRRGILKEKFRGFEALPQVQSDGSYMTVGLLVHDILQKTLELKVDKLPEIEKIYEEVIQSFNAISLLHQCGMSVQDCRAHIQPYIPQIYNFIKCYMKGEKQRSTEKNFEGQIDTIRDIEENIWLPKLGLKGKIDVSVEVKINSRRKIMPLELKTGKSSFSPEHKGQVILYTIMMSLIGQDVDSGLLLYLKDNTMQEVKSSRHEQRDLLMLRNTISYYLSKKSNVNVDNFGDIKELQLDLPEPINHRNACSSCPVNHLCCMYLAHDEDFRRKDSTHPLKALSEKLLSHLKPEHINYVMRWVKLQQIEEDSNTANSSMKDMWTMKPQQREKKGNCICNLNVVEVEKKEERFSHTLKKIKSLEDADKDFTHSEINESDYIVINTNDLINIASGYVSDISNDSITVLLDRNITKRYTGCVFHVDKYFSANLSNYNRAGVSGLLTDNENCSRLRSIIIERKPATFKTQLPRRIAPISAPILARLNKQQQRAIFKILTTNEYVLLKGMPGTGKTRTLVALIELLVKIGKSVLVTANTHSAVDNILIGLMERNIDFLRLGSQAKVHPLLTNYSEYVVTAQCKTPESLRDVYASKNVVGVTCFGAYHKLFESRKFDMCLVDESTQAQQCVVLKPLYNAKKFILVGDPEQLPPIAKSEAARKLGFNESLFARLDSENNTIVLSAQYRMNRDIMTLANKLTYKDQLEAGNEEVANATLSIKNTELLQSCDWWLQAALSLKLEDSVILLNTSIPKDFEPKPEYNKKSGKIYTNTLEAAIIQRLVDTLLKIGLSTEDIGIIAPFRAQVNLLGRAVSKDVEVSTVDQYQGREKNIIVYSCTESSPQDCANTRAFHILDDHNRLTVAVTRAKYKLVIIGDEKILESYTPFEKLLRFIRRENVIDLFNENKSFDWRELIDSFNKSKM